MNKLKEIFNNKKVMFGTSSFVTIASLIGILIIINFFLSELDWKSDLTKDKRYSISKQSVDYIKTLKRDVRIIVFTDTSLPVDIEYVLEEYKGANKNIKIEYVDPNKNPVFANNYNKDDSGVGRGTIVVQSGNKWRKLQTSEFFMSDQQVGKEFSRMEQKITGAISYVCGSKDIVIYALTGHEEKSFDTLYTIKAALDDSNYTVKDLNLLTEGQVPQDAQMVAIVDPRSDLSLDEKTRIDKYLESGGKLFITLESFAQSNKKFSNLEKVLKDYNITINNDTIIETDQTKVFYGYPHYLIPDIQDNEITSSIVSKNMHILFPGARSLGIIKNDNHNIKVMPIAESSENSWGETDIKIVKKDSNDLPGPLNVAVAAEKDNIIEGKVIKSKIIVFGDTEFLFDQVIIENGAAGNIDLFTNCISWLSEHAELINIQSKALITDTFMVTPASVITIIIIIIIVTLALITVGIVVWLKRRNL